MLDSLIMKKHRIHLSSLVLLLSATSACSVVDKQPSHYTMDDFHGVNKIDVHVHANSRSSAFIEQAQADNFKLLSINVDYPDFPALKEQAQIASDFAKQHKDVFHFATTFSMLGSDQPDWQNQVIGTIDTAVANGAIAVKVWKNIGMDFRDKNQQLVMIDDDKFDRIFNHIEELGIPLIGHQGEPKNCWLPVAEMTVNNDKLYFSEHPQYHMYLHPEFPSYEEQMQARNNMLSKHPGLPFMGAHLASLEWSVDEIAAFLDQYPEAVVDLAARMGQVQYQSKLDRAKVRAFFIKYQDRILYATDLTQAPDSEAAEFKQQSHTKWLEDWQYLNTEQELTVPEVDGAVQGLALPKEVVDKIYSLNAQKFFSL
jgi:predicted TIM-barrel fold metal-dependent hydrolase